MPALTYAIRSERDGSTSLQLVTLKGDLAGEMATTLPALHAALGRDPVAFDCAEVVHINSLGVRSWHHFLQLLDAKAPYEFRRCPVFFVDYANMIPELIGSGPITSFHAPLRCESCGASTTVLLEATAAQATGDFGQHACGACGGRLAPEVPPADFLAFLDPEL